MHKLPFSVSRLCWAMVAIATIWFYAQFGKEAYNFYGDALGYYMYLPSTFIYHNHKSIEKLPNDRGIRPFIHSYAAQIGNGEHTPKGYVLNQYTYGVALLELPFFLAAHGWEKLTQGQANGFSESYRLAIDISTIFYGCIGLWLTYRLLKRRFSQNVASITTALLLIGTNLFWFMFHQQGMAHVPLFFLFAVLLSLTELIYSESKYYQFALLGLTAGLITLIRPIDGLGILIPICYANGKPFIKSKLEFVRKHWASILLAGFCFVLPLIPQMLYWKWLTGYFIYDSYGPNQKFSFFHPHLWIGIFSASNGWLFYSPLMIFALSGFFIIRKWRGLAAGMALFLILYIWCVYSWYLPNYINGLGSRPMVDAYAVLAIPMAAFIDWLSGRSRFLIVTCSLMLAFCIWVSINYSIKKSMGNLFSDDSKYRFNFQTFFRFNLNYNDLVVWDIDVPQPNEKELKLIQQHCYNIPDSASSAQILNGGENQKYYLVQQGEEYPPLSIKLKVRDLAKSNVRWLCASGRFQTTQPVDDIYNNQLLVMQIRRGDSTLEWNGVRINNKVGLLEPGNNYVAGLTTFRDNIWGTVRYFIPVPDDAQPNDEIEMSLWNLSKKPIMVQELCVGEFD